MQQDTHEVGHHDSPWQGGGASAARPASSDFGTGENAAGPGAGKSAGAGKCALILEGGSFRGQFVIDVMLEQGVDLPACYGVSAGALNGLNYKSRQIGRVNRINLAFCNDQRYVGSRALAANGSLIGYDFLLFDVQDRIDPFDNEAYRANPMKLFATVTNIMFGTAESPEVQDASLDIDVVRATTSLPLVTQPVELSGSLYLDGGVADSVPIEHVLEEEGYDRAIVVLTQHRGYRKSPYELPAARARYAAYPYLLDALSTRHERYNEQREHIWAYEREGRALVVAPPHPVTVGHVERDASKLLELYIAGRQEATRMLRQIKEFAER